MIAEVEELTFEWRYAADDLWDTLTRLAGPLARVINELPEDEKQGTRAAIEQSLARIPPGRRAGRPRRLLGRGRPLGGPDMGEIWLEDRDGVLLATISNPRTA